MGTRPSVAQFPFILSKLASEKIVNVREAPGRAILEVQRGKLDGRGFGRTCHVFSLVFLFLTQACTNIHTQQQPRNF